MDHFDLVYNRKLPLSVCAWQTLHITLSYASTRDNRNHPQKRNYSDREDTGVRGTSGSFLHESQALHCKSHTVDGLESILCPSLGGDTSYRHVFKNREQVSNWATIFMTITDTFIRVQLY